MDSPIIGIDLGGLNSCVAVFRNGQVEIIPSNSGGKIIPSYVSFTDTDILIGQAAKDQMKINPKNTIFNAKRLIGRTYESRKVKENMKYWPFNVIKESQTGQPKIQINSQNEEKIYSPQNIITMILRNLKQNASNFLGKEVNAAVISIPNYFNYIQREEILEAAKQSGLIIERFVHSSNAVGLTYLFQKNINEKENKNIIIFDLGSGTLNISVLENHGEGLVEIKSLNGDVNLGGEDFTNRLFEYCEGEFRKKTGLDIYKNPKVVNRLYDACEKAKINLSSNTEIPINLEYLMDNEDFNIIISRSKFEGFCIDLFKNCISSLENALKETKLNKSEINDIILVGGSSKIPKIQQMIQEFFEGKELNKELNPEESIAYGLAIQAAISRGIKDPKIDNFILLNVLPFSIGIETVGGVMNVLYKRNSDIPGKQTKLFTTYDDNQTFATIKIYE